jgi:hypothetical protein
MAKMTESELSAILSSEINSSVGWIGGDLSQQRQRALDFYLGSPLGNEMEGRSKVVCSEVQDTVEWIMPALMDIFMGGDEAVVFAPQGQEDEAAAQQATEYVNWILLRDNPGFVVTYSAFKDALIQKNGIIKAWWAPEEDNDEVRTVESVPPESFALALSDPDIEITKQEQGKDGTYSYTYRDKPDGRCQIMGVPPEEFLIDKKARSIPTARFVGHRMRKTVSELVEMGFDRKDVESIPEGDDADTNAETQTRDRFSDAKMPDTEGKGASRTKWVNECYIRVDWDGDGIAERRKVTAGGPTGAVILANEPWEGPPPFVSLTPIIMPHRFFGIAIADLVMDLQIIKSTILRQILDNMYQAVNSRLQVSDQVNLDDLLVSRPGGIVRLKNGAMPSQGHILPVEQQLIISSSFPLLEYLDSIRENRTGVTRYNQGTDANSLNKTATGITKIMGAADQRMKLIARVFAETGYKDLMWLILKTVTANQSRARTIRLSNGQWQAIDPREWENKFDLVVNVGIGTGDKQQQLAGMMQLLTVQTQGVQMQGGADGPIVTKDNLYNTLKELPALLGRKGADRYFTDPQTAPPTQPPPNPEMLKIQAQQQSDQAKLQAQAQTDAQKLQQQAQIDAQKMMLDAKKLEADVILAQQKLQLEREKMMADIQLERERAAAQTQLEGAKLQSSVAIEHKKADLQASVATRGQDITRESHARDAEMKQQERQAKETPTAKSGGKKTVTFKREGGQIVGADITESGG